jgi:hypothetical protein
MRVALAVVATAVAGTLGVESLCASEQGPPAKSEAKSLVLNLELLGSRPLVRVTVNGKGPFAFLVRRSRDLAG